MSKHRFFIAGTDTGVGKTAVSCGLLKRWGDAGASTAAFKPVISAVSLHENDCDDTDLLQQHMSVNLTREQISPYQFASPVSPNIVAMGADPISLDVIVEAYDNLDARSLDLLLVEGAGGWHAPISETHTMSDVAKALGLPVILVVGLRLGCLNHSLLTANAIASTDLRLAGWVANCIDPDMQALSENLDTLRQRLPAPCLGVLPWLD